MTSAIERLELLPAGRTASNTARKIVRMARRIANPEVPDGQQLSKVAFRGKEFAILHRRNYVDTAVVRQCFLQGQYDMPGGTHGLLADRFYEGIVASGSGPEVPMLSLATLLAAKPEALYVPFILKIDIEGAETALFDGDCSAVGRFPIIIMEPHDWLLPGQHSSLGFFRFHAAAGREFCVKNENIASIAFESL